MLSLILCFPLPDSFFKLDIKSPVFVTAIKIRLDLKTAAFSVDVQNHITAQNRFKNDLLRRIKPQVL